MKSRLVTVWCVHTNNDDVRDGEPTHFFSQKSDAKAMAKGNGWYGSDAPVSERHAVIHRGEVYLVDRIGVIDVDQKLAEKRQELRKQTIVKLTPEELEALTNGDQKISIS